MNGAKYRWPASGITPGLMRRLWLVRERSQRPTSIATLIADAVEAAYGEQGRRAEYETDPAREAA